MPVWSLVLFHPLLWAAVAISTEKEYNIDS